MGPGYAENIIKQDFIKRLRQVVLATLACARLLELDLEQTGHALGLASTRAAGLKSQFGTMDKLYDAGVAVASVIESAMLA